MQPHTIRDEAFELCDDNKLDGLCPLEFTGHSGPAVQNRI